MLRFYYAISIVQLYIHFIKAHFIRPYSSQRHISFIRPYSVHRIIQLKMPSAFATALMLLLSVLIVARRIETVSINQGCGSGCFLLEA